MTEQHRSRLCLLLLRTIVTFIVVSSATTSILAAGKLTSEITQEFKNRYHPDRGEST